MANKQVADKMDKSQNNATYTMTKTMGTGRNSAPSRSAQQVGGRFAKDFTVSDVGNYGYDKKVNHAKQIGGYGTCK